MMVVNLIAAVFGLFGMTWLTACAAPVHVGTYSNQQRMVGTTKAAVLALLMQPHHRNSSGLWNWRYGIGTQNWRCTTSKTNRWTAAD